LSPFDIQAPELSLRLGKQLNAYGSTMLRAVDDVIYPVILVDDLRNTGGTKRNLAGFEFSVAAVAAQFSILVLTNPIGSKIRVYPTWSCFRSSANDNIIVTVGPAIVPAVSLTSMLNPSGQIADARVETKNSAVMDGTPVMMLGASISGNTATDALRGTVLLEGQSIQLTAATLNTTMTFGLMWEEEPNP
jgi:hypothetical protein